MSSIEGELSDFRRWQRDSKRHIAQPSDERRLCSVCVHRHQPFVALAVLLVSFTLHAGAVVGHPSDEALPVIPDYDDSTQWYVHDRNAVADIFYVISTETGDYQSSDGNICHYADTYNDSIRFALNGEMVGVDLLLSGELNFYSPYYRQCTLQTFTADSLVVERLPLALEDVNRAFNHYMKHENQGRPFILMGYSQGAMAVLQLLQEMDSTTYSRMIAAYAIGVNIPTALLESCPLIVPAHGELDTGVTISYNSVRDPSCVVHMLGDDNAVAINPVNWCTDDTPSTLISVPSPMIREADQKADTLTVHLDPATRLLLVDGYTGNDYVLPLIGKDGNYHSREIWLYRRQLCENIANRTRTYLSRH